MKKLALALLLLGSAQATNWQYATLGKIDTHFSWQAPDKVTRAEKLGDLITAIGCKGETYTQFFNCVGADGWELVVRYEDSIPSLNLKTLEFIFKRAI